MKIVRKYLLLKANGDCRLVNYQPTTKATAISRAPYDSEIAPDEMIVPIDIEVDEAWGSTKIIEDAIQLDATVVKPKARASVVSKVREKYHMDDSP